MNKNKALLVWIMAMLSPVFTDLVTPYFYQVTAPTHPAFNSAAFATPLNKQHMMSKTAKAGFDQKQISPN
ncbi:hypothetical protein [Chitiniphilus eburneus]|uniref:Uncharacterized protein n=1 Tax=Chitiniphilus eburneus TaxID=2571148 RepID=A0A4U0PJP3_9NEIS|nr:hypothetical protein [Chitiniphilus eburneus]TJZ67432.1 hypothetical protein FAZ21_16305 [Chitiniphilus eburneus]